MLMDLFFAVAPVRCKRRIHFHRFMQEVHSKLHAMKRAHPDLGRSDPAARHVDRGRRKPALLR